MMAMISHTHDLGLLDKLPVQPKESEVHGPKKDKKRVGGEEGY